MTVDIFEMVVHAGWFVYSVSALTSLSLYLCANKQQTFMLLQHFMRFCCHSLHNICNMNKLTDFRMQLRRKWNSA